MYRTPEVSEPEPSEREPTTEADAIRDEDNFALGMRLKITLAARRAAPDHQDRHHWAPPDIARRRVMRAGRWEPIGVRQVARMR